MNTNTTSVNPENISDWHKNRLRITVWGGAVLLLLLPLLAMQFSQEVTWTLPDFLVFGGMLLAACAAFELALKLSRNKTYLLAFCIAIATVFILVWVELAVGIF